MKIGKIFRKIRRSQGCQPCHAADEKPDAPLQHPQQHQALFFHQKNHCPQQNNADRPPAQPHGTQKQSLHIHHVAFFLFVEEFLLLPIYDGVYHQVIPVTF